MKVGRGKQIAIGVVVLALAAGCGSRIEEARVQAAGNGPGTGLPNVAASTADVPVPNGAVDSAGTGVTPAGVAAGPAASAAPGPAVAGTQPAVAAPASAAPGKSGGNGAKPGGVVASGSAPCTAQGPPIVIGQTGVFSGVIGQSTGGIRSGLAAWAAMINKAGGLACHPIQLFQMDDGSDPSRTAANTQTLIEQKKAVAIVGANVPVTTAAFRSVIAKFKVPAIGGDLVTPDWNEDPLMFPQGGTAYATNLGGVKAMAQLTGKKKVGIAYCVEASACQYVAKSIQDPKGSADAGIQVVTVQQISLTQTDFTSTCQNMKNAGAEAIATAMDSASLTRLARSCAAIGYEVPIWAVSLSISSSLVSDKQLNKIGLFAGAPNSPFMLINTAAEKEFQQSLTNFVPGAIPDAPTMAGWAAGKLFQAAIEGLGTAARTQALTSARVMDGVWSLKNETLGGLAPPLTYPKGKPTPAVNCFYAFKMSGGAFSAPFGNKVQCL